MVKVVLVRIVQITVCLVILSGVDAFGAEKPKLWSNLCASCHDGKTAPGAEEFRAAYKTAEEFTEAVKAKGSRCMNLVRNDEKVIHMIAEEIGIGSGKK